MDAGLDGLLYLVTRNPLSKSSIKNLKIFSATSLAGDIAEKRKPIEHFELLPAGRQVLNLLNKTPKNATSLAGDIALLPPLTRERGLGGEVKKC